MPKGGELIRHGRFFKASRTLLIPAVFASLIEGVSSGKSAFRSTNTPGPIRARAFPFELHKPFPARPGPLSQGNLGTTPADEGPKSAAVRICIVLPRTHGVTARWQSVKRANG